MPLIIKVSVSRKLTEDYNSRGWTLDIQSEFDPRTFDDTETLANSTNHLFQMASDLLDEQVQHAAGGVNGNARGKSDVRLESQNQPGARGNGRSNRFQHGAYSGAGNGNGHSNGNGNAAKSNGNGRTERTITSAQINAINKMASKFDTNGEVVALEDYDCKLSALTIRQASELIDRLKKGLETKEDKGVGQ